MMKKLIESLESRLLDIMEKNRDLMSENANLASENGNLKSMQEAAAAKVADVLARIKSLEE